MAITKEDILKLLALQQRDSALDKLQSEINRIPKEIQRLKDGLEREKTAWNEAKTRIIDLEKGKKDKELELASKEEVIRKNSVSLNQVKTNDAFKALQTEIDRAKQQGSDLETAILEVMEALDGARRREKELAAQFKAVDDKAKAAISALEAELADLRGKFDAAKTTRDADAAPMPADMMKVYNHTRSRGKLDAVVPIKDGLCSACRITLAPQVIVEAHQGRKLVICESCQRILYRSEPPVAKTETHPSPAA